MSGLTDATRPGVERMIVWGFVGIRVLDLGQTAVAMATGSLQASPEPRLNLAVFVVVVIDSFLLCVWLVRRRSTLPLRWPVWFDFAVTLLALVAAAIFVEPEARTNVWSMWPYPVTLSSTVLIGGTLGRWPQAMAVSGAFSVTYVAVLTAPSVGDPAMVAAAIANALAYPGFSMVSYLFMTFVRRLADTADTAKARVADLERERSKAVVHDLLPYLKLDRFLDADDRQRQAMVSQAGRAYQQMRSFIDGDDAGSSVFERLTAVVDRHSSLDVRSVIDIGSPVTLADDVLERLQQALDTALSNVEQYAPDATVSVTVNADPAAVRVTIRDDGPGFDPASATAGFGLREILGRHLAKVGGEGVVTSAPGRGTEVRITVPRQT